MNPRTLKVCNCNRTMKIDARGLAKALNLDEPITVHAELCRKDVQAFAAALGGDDCIVACTQEATLFGELASTSGTTSRIKFINVREAGGWSAEGAQAMPKIAALLAAAELPEPEPLASIAFQSAGELLIIGPAAAAIPWAERLAGDLAVNVLITDARAGELPLDRRYPIWSGSAVRASGFLGSFEVAWEQINPIDLDLCTRCNACVRACPEQAIDFSYQIDFSKCQSHRACVQACGEIGAIDFDRQDRAHTERFDMVLDLSDAPLIKTAQKPQGYAAPGRDPLDQALAVQTLAKLVGEFEKPRFFQYHEKICAHGRSGKVGCTRCLDVCSTGAISAAGDKIKVEPHLCAGCGGCATVCPSGAMTHAYPRVVDLGARLRRLLSVYQSAGGRDAAILFHNGGDARELMMRLARRGKGLPARVIPIEIHHIAAVGLDLALAAISYGASQVIVLSTGMELDEYGPALEKQFGYGQTVLNALGFAGSHLHCMRAAEIGDLEQQIWALKPARSVSKAATFNLSNDKRTTLDFVFDHLAKQAPTPQTSVPLASGAPYGAIKVNKETCTLCKACIGACPVAALQDSQDAPRLRFIEANCVQCGLCEVTCPEQAISLVARLTIGPERKNAVTLNEAEPFNCVRCATPFGTRQMIDTMMGRLTAHSMFAGGGALRRLQMCADCRVVDMMENKDEVSIHQVKR